MPELPPSITELIESYAQGPALLKAALADFPAEKLSAPLPPGEWSAMQIVCHLADFEIVCADRIKAIVAEDGPQIPSRDENRFLSRLHYEQRNLSDELSLIEAVRRQLTRLLKSLAPADYQRVGIHSLDGPLTLETLLSRIVRHIPHHADFIARKKQRLLQSA